MVADPSFAAQEAEAVASLIDRDEVDAAEEEVFGAVVRWVQADEGARTNDLDQLLPLVRFAMMASTAAAAAEPLFAGHRLCAELLAECELDFDGVAVCRRLRPRMGRRHPRDPLDPLDLEWMETLLTEAESIDGLVEMLPTGVKANLIDIAAMSKEEAEGGLEALGQALASAEGDDKKKFEFLVYRATPAKLGPLRPSVSLPTMFPASVPAPQHSSRPSPPPGVRWPFGDVRG